MEGDIADLTGIVRLAKLYGARIYVDEAHGIGVLGPAGAGAAEHLGVLDEIDIVMGTFSKSLASVGGFVASTTEVIDYLKHTSRPFVFSASLPPASVAAVGAALDVMRKEPERQQ
jgi:7-keto-8-aminopelargonate synthetase-like enzyme